MLDDLFEMFGDHKRRRGHGHGDDHHGYEDDHHYHGNYNDGYVNNQPNPNVNNGRINPDGYANEQANPNINNGPFNRGYRQQYGHDSFDLRMMLSKVFQNKQLLIVLAVAAIILFVLFIAAIILLLPIIFKMLSIVDKNGVKGIIDSLMPLLNKLWLGSQG